jgi:PAS domain S-box-containing protein
VLGKSARTVIPTTPLSGNLADWLDALQKEGYWKGEVIQLNRTGERIRIQSSLAAVKNEKGEITSFVTVNRDVTQVRKIEQELKNAKEQLEITFANTPSAIYRFNKSGVLEYLNQRGAEMLGFRSTDEVLQCSITEMNAHIEERFVRLFEDGTTYTPERGSVYKAFASGEQSEAPIQMIDKKTGQAQWILTSSTPVKDNNNQIAFVLAVATDITNQKRAEESLRKSEEELERLVAERTKELHRSNEDLQQFAHVASHDLKEPVRKIKTFASRLESEKSELLDERGKQFLAKIQSASDRMLKMIEGVLNYSTIGALGSSEFEAVDLNAIMRDIMNDLEVVLQKSKAKITCNNLPVVQGVPIRIYQLFYNLMINSLKFARPEIPPEIRLEGSIVNKDGQKMARIVVKDNGIGFEKSQSKMIFDTFTRLHSLDKYEGTGLGLALCKKIVERHGGTIEADGMVNEGATFTVHLPI